MRWQFPPVSHFTAHIPITRITVEPRWLEHRWLVYHVSFELLLSPYKILPIAQEDKYVGRISYFIMELCVV